MQSINITQVNDQNWYIATLIMLSGKIYQGFGRTKLEAIDDLIIEFNK